MAFARVFHMERKTSFLGFADGGERRRRILITAAFAVVFIFAGTVAILSQTKVESQQEGAAAAVAVRVGTVSRKPVPVQLKAIGTVETCAMVSVKTRVGGELTGIHFLEGQQVKKGDLLFTIDPRPYQVALQEARAALERDTALADKAATDLKRYTELAQKGYVSEEKFDEIRSTAEALNATVASDRAKVENARLQLDYCTIRAPLTGRTGSLNVHQGSQIKANDDNGMVDITQMTPIYVAFSIPEREFPSVRHYLQQGQLQVEVTIPGDSAPAEQGELSFVDNRVDSRTGTIRLKATFDNTDNRLWPGQFISAVLTLTTLPEALVIPSAALQTGQQGLYVFVVKPDTTVESRPVTTGMAVGEETVVESGLKAGEIVVTDGQLRLVAGSRVEVAASAKNLP
jgi:multidrug efflux system membrane fusion protein